MADENKKPIIPTLTRANYHAWLAAVKDELYAIQAGPLLNKSELDAHGAEQRGNVADDVVDGDVRRKAYIMLKRSISDDIKKKLEDVGQGEVETLLRRVRLSFYKPSPHMVEMLHNKIASITIDAYPNMDDYTLDFQRVAAQMLNCGGKVDDSLLKMWFLKGLSADYAMVKFQATAANMTLADTYLAIVNFAGTDPKLTGSTHPAHKKARPQVASTAQEFKPDGMCRIFANTGKCRFGDKCKFKHTKTPGDKHQTKDTNAATNKATADVGCAACKKKGFAWKNHTTAECGL